MKLLIHWFTDLVFPARCMGCHTYGSVLCLGCLAAIPIQHYQKQPGLFVAGHADHPLLSQAIYALKYSGVTAAAAPLTDYLISALAKHNKRIGLFSENPLIVPVPLHPRRRAERGFNQSELLASHLAARIGMECRPHVLERTRNTTSQVGTGSRQKRIDNMKGVFVCREPELVAGRDIVLIDDVCTTGATLQACIEALEAAHPKSVSSIVLARGQ